MVIKWNSFKNIFNKQKGLGILSFSDISGTAITSIFWFYMASVIQPEEYGEIFYFISIVAIAFNLSNIGTQNNMVVLTAKGKNLESTLNFLSIMFGVISSLALIIIFYQIDIIILLFGYLINGLSLGYLIGKQFYSQYGKYLLLQKILTVILGLSFFYFFGADGIITALGISYVGFIAVIIKFHKNSRIDFLEFKNNFSFIWHNFSLKFIGALRENIDKLIIVPIIGFSFLGNYALTMQVIALMSMPNAIFYKYMLTNDSRRVQNKTLKRLYLLGATGLAIVCSVFLPIIVPDIFPNFTEMGILQIMSFVLIPKAIVSIKYSEFLGEEKSKPVFLSAIVGLISMVTGIAILGSVYGAFGIAITYVLTTSLMAIFLLIWAKK